MKKEMKYFHTDFIPTNIFLDVIDVFSQRLIDKSDIYRTHEKHELGMKVLRDGFFFFNEKC